MLNPLAHLVQLTLLWSQAGVIYLQCFPPVHVIESCRWWKRDKDILSECVLSNREDSQRNSLFSPVPSSVGNVRMWNIIYFSLRKGYDILISGLFPVILCIKVIMLLPGQKLFMIARCHYCPAVFLPLSSICNYLQRCPSAERSRFTRKCRGKCIQTAVTACLTRWTTDLSQYDTLQACKSHGCDKGTPTCKPTFPRRHGVSVCVYRFGLCPVTEHKLVGPVNWSRLWH